MGTCHLPTHRAFIIVGSIGEGRGRLSQREFGGSLQGVHHGHAFGNFLGVLVDDRRRRRIGNQLDEGIGSWPFLEETNEPREIQS